MTALHEKESGLSMAVYASLHQRSQNSWIKVSQSYSDRYREGLEIVLPACLLQSSKFDAIPNPLASLKDKAKCRNRVKMQSSNQEFDNAVFSEQDCRTKDGSHFAFVQYISFEQALLIYHGFHLKIASCGHDAPTKPRFVSMMCCRLLLILSLLRRTHYCYCWSTAKSDWSFRHHSHRRLGACQSMSPIWMLQSRRQSGLTNYTFLVQFSGETGTFRTGKLCAVFRSSHCKHRYSASVMQNHLTRLSDLACITAMVNKIDSQEAVWHPQDHKQRIRLLSVFYLGPWVCQDCARIIGFAKLV